MAGLPHPGDMQTAFGIKTLGSGTVLVLASNALDSDMAVPICDNYCYKMCLNFEKMLRLNTKGYDINETKATMLTPTTLCVLSGSFQKYPDEMAGLAPLGQARTGQDTQTGQARAAAMPSAAMMALGVVSRTLKIRRYRRVRLYAPACILFCIRCDSLPSGVAGGH